MSELSQAVETKIPCPNPKCDALLAPGQTVCMVCEHEVGACPNCGKMMSKTIGRCGWCGYRLGEKPTVVQSEAPPKAKEETRPVTPPRPPEAPVILRFEPARPAVTEMLAKAYFQAALSGADMPNVMRVLESVRTALLAEPNALKIWRQLDEVIGVADVTTFQPALIALRTQFEQHLFAQQGQRLSMLFEQNAEHGWREWLLAYAEALSRWRLLLCEALVSLPLPFPDEFRQPIDFQRATHLILHERWPEVHAFFTHLAQFDFLPPTTRARLLIPVGQIYLYYFTPRTRALAIFEQAAQLAPGLARVLAALGDYYKEQNEPEKALAYLEQAIEAAPDEVEAYVYQGDIADKQGKAEEARTWYQEAISRVPGDSFGYSRLLRLYGRPEFIEKYGAFIVPLAERAMVVDETGRYKTYLDVGDAYSATRNYEAAHQWYDKAVALDPTRMDGYTWKGFAYLDEGVSRYDEARAVFEKAREVAPESYNGYWGLGQLAEREKRWAEAAEWYAQALARQPEFHSSITARIGDMHRQLGQFEQAEALLLDALRADPTNDATVLELADDYYRKHDRPDDALRLYGQIREIKGEAFEAGYQNRLGNVYFYQNQHELSAQHYRKAIEADPTQSVYFSNLGGAYREMQRWDEAREQFEKAYALHKDEPKYKAHIARVYYEEARAYEQALPTAADASEMLERAIAAARAAVAHAPGETKHAEKLAGLEQQRTFIRRYGGAALALEPIDKPLRVHVESQGLPLILNAEMNELSAETLRLIEEMRQHLRGRYGLTIPGINFAVLQNARAGEYKIDVLGDQVAYGNLRPDQHVAVCSRAQLREAGITGGTMRYVSSSLTGFPEAFWLKEADANIAREHGLTVLDPRAYLLQHIEFVIVHQLERLCGHQEASDLLAKCETSRCKEVQRDPRQLHALTRRLKESLRRMEPIPDLAGLCESLPPSATTETVAANGSGPASTPLEPGVNALTVYIPPASPLNRAELAQELIGLQALLFNEQGVIIPSIDLNESENLEPHAFQLQIDDQRLAPMPGLAPGEFWVYMPYETIKNQLPESRSSVEPNTGGPAAIVKGDEALRQEYQTRGYSTRDPLGYVIFCVAAALRRQPEQMLTCETVEHYLYRLKTSYRALVDVTQHYFSLEALTGRLRERLSARASIRNLPKVLEELLSAVE